MRANHLLQLSFLSAIWGATFMFTRLAVPVLGSNMVAFVRMSLAALTLAAIMRALGHAMPWEHWRQMLWLGFLGVAAPHIFYAASAYHFPASYASLLSVSAVFFGAIATAWMGLEKLTPIKWGACILGFVGSFLVVRLGPLAASPELIWGGVACLLGSFFSGMVTPYLKQATEKLEPLSITAGMHVAAVVFLIPGAIYDLPRTTLEPKAWAAVAFMGVVTSGFGFWGYTRIMRSVEPIAALSSTFLITGFGILWAYLVLDEIVTLRMLIGIVFLVLACLLIMFGDRYLEKRRPPVR